MAISKDSTLYKQLENSVKKAERKLNAMKKKDENISIEDFGFDKRALKIPKEIDTKTAKEKIAILDEFTETKYKLKKIGNTIEGGKVTPVYMSNVAYKRAVDEIKAENKFREKMARALSEVGGYNYYRLTSQGLVADKSNLYNATVTKSSDFIPIRISIQGTKGFIGELKGTNMYRDYTYTADRFKKEYSKFMGRAVDTTHKRIQNLRANWLKGLGNSVSYQFETAIRKILRDNKIDAVDFLGLFYLSGAFDFDFIYDETVTKEQKKEQIKSEIEIFRQDKERYQRFRDILLEE